MSSNAALAEVHNTYIYIYILCTPASAALDDISCYDCIIDIAKATSYQIKIG